MNKGEIVQLLRPIVAVTGHRTLDHNESNIRIQVRHYLRTVKPVCVYIGMALGFDMLVAEECLKMRIPFVAAVPFRGQERYWLPGQRKTYRSLLENAKQVDIVFDGGFATWKYLKRNEYMIRHATHVLAYWSGEQKSGTGHAVNHAEKKALPVTNLYTFCRQTTEDFPLVGRDGDPEQN